MKKSKKILCIITTCVLIVCACSVPIMNYYHIGHKELGSFIPGTVWLSEKPYVRIEDSFDSELIDKSNNKINIAFKTFHTLLLKTEYNVSLLTGDVHSLGEIVFYEKTAVIILDKDAIGKVFEPDVKRIELKMIKPVEVTPDYYNKGTKFGDINYFQFDGHGSITAKMENSYFKVDYKQNGDSYDLTFIKNNPAKRENDDFYSQWEDVAGRYDPYNEYKNGDVVFTGKAKFYEKVCCFTQDTNDINVEHEVYYKYYEKIICCFIDYRSCIFDERM